MATEIVLALGAVASLIESIIKAVQHPDDAPGQPVTVDRKAVEAARAKIDALLAGK
jgi:hypothetical protein